MQLASTSAPLSPLAAGYRSRMNILIEAGAICVGTVAAGEMVRAYLRRAMSSPLRPSPRENA